MPQDVVLSLAGFWGRSKGVYWGYIGIVSGNIGVYWDNGKENGNYYSIMGYNIGVI